MKQYKYYEVISCRLAIRVCIGYGANGRKKHRTFSMRNINPNASWDGIMAVIRALAPVLEFPIVDVQKVTSRKIIFYEDVEPAALDAPAGAEFLSALPALPAVSLDAADSLNMEIAIWEEMARKKQEQEKLPPMLYMRSGMELRPANSRQNLLPGLTARAPPVGTEKYNPGQSSG